jgi:tRNA/tmRNA/rRNA uracil-C5-methylase (TrmA/RlmC/RlmD family)
VVHHPLVNEVAREVRRILAELRVAPYSDQAHLGTVRALQLAVERSSQTVQLVVVTRDAHLPPLDPLFAAISERIGNKLHSLWWNANPERTNTLLGPDFVKLAGKDSIIERFEGIAVHYPPGAFGQSNLQLFERLARRVGTFVPDGSRLLEFYGGTGALSLPIAHRLDSVVINEISTGSLQGLRLGVAGLPENDAAKVGVLAGPAAAFAREVERADIVLADPPRKGLDPELLDALLRTPPARFVYLSCGLASFLDQAERLLDSGKFALTALELFALFPFTEHVETLAVFDRRSADTP